MKKEKNCLSIYWSLHQSIIHGNLCNLLKYNDYILVDCNLKEYFYLFVILSGLKLVESYPYETVHRDYDYVRLASITAGKFTDPH